MFDDEILDSKVLDDEWDRARPVKTQAPAPMPVGPTCDCQKGCDATFGVMSKIGCSCCAPAPAPAPAPVPTPGPAEVEPQSCPISAKDDVPKFIREIAAELRGMVDEIGTVNVEASGYFNTPGISSGEVALGRQVSLLQNRFGLVASMLDEEVRKITEHYTEVPDPVGWACMLGAQVTLRVAQYHEFALATRALIVALRGADAAASEAAWKRLAASDPGDLPGPSLEATQPTKPATGVAPAGSLITSRTTQAACEAVTETPAGFWYNDRCNANARAVASRRHQWECEHGTPRGYWYNDRCNISAQNLAAITSQSACNQAGGSWNPSGSPRCSTARGSSTACPYRADEQITLADGSSMSRCAFLALPQDERTRLAPNASQRNEYVSQGIQAGITALQGLFQYLSASERNTVELRIAEINANNTRLQSELRDAIAQNDSARTSAAESQMNTMLTTLMGQLATLRQQTGQDGTSATPGWVWPVAIVGGVVVLGGMAAYALSARSPMGYYPPGYPPPPQMPYAPQPQPLPAPPARSNPDEHRTHVRISWDPRRDAWRLVVEEANEVVMRAELKYDFQHNRLFTADSSSSDIQSAAETFLAGHDYPRGSYHLTLQ